MKKLSLAVLLLGLAVSAVLSGCNQNSDNTTPAATSTNAPAGTNAPAK